MIKCEIVWEKLFLEEERPSLGVQSKNSCWVIYDECSLHFGEICEAKDFGNSLF